MSGGYWETFLGCAKNTLVTVRDGDVVYFGIARYDKRYGLPFEKKVGRKIALGRLNKATAAMPPQSFVRTFDGVVYADSRLAGCCNVNSVKYLLEYFDNIDRLFPQERTLYNAENSAAVLAGVVNEKDFPDTTFPAPEREAPSLTVDPERMSQLAGINTD
jgi:hypothetical protein